MTFLPYYSTETAIFCGRDRFCPMRFSAPFRSSGFVYKLIHHHIHFSVQDDMHFYPSVSRIFLFLLSPAENTEDHRSIPADQDRFVGQKDRIPAPVRRDNVPNGLIAPSSFYKKGRLSASGSFPAFSCTGNPVQICFFRYTDAFAAAAFRASTLSSFSQGRSRSFLPKCP